MIITALTPRKIWIGVKLEALPKPLSSLWVIHLPFWMLSTKGITAKAMFFWHRISLFCDNLWLHFL
jgi:hypothetical protein